MKAEASRRNGYFARVASSTQWERREAIKAHGGEPRNELRAHGLDVLRRPTLAHHSLAGAGAPGGGSMTPSCCIIPPPAHWPQFSTVGPSWKRETRMPEIFTRFSVSQVS